MKTDTNARLSRAAMGLVLATSLVVIAGCDNVEIVDAPPPPGGCRGLPWARHFNQWGGATCPNSNSLLGASLPRGWSRLQQDQVIGGFYLGNATIEFGRSDITKWGVELRTCNGLNGLCPGTVPVVPHSQVEPPIGQNIARVSSFIGPRTANGYWNGELANVQFVGGRRGLWADIVPMGPDGQVATFDDCEAQYASLIPQLTWSALLEDDAEAADLPTNALIDGELVYLPNLFVQHLYTYPRSRWVNAAFLADEGGMFPLSNYERGLAAEFQHKMDQDDDLICGDETPSYSHDNCPTVPNPGQENWDHDSIGDACDNCDRFINPEQTDGNSDGVGNACERVTIHADLAPVVPQFINALEVAELNIEFPYELRAVTPNAPFDTPIVRFRIYRNNEVYYEGDVDSQNATAAIRFNVAQRSRIPAGQYTAKIESVRQNSNGDEEQLSEVSRDFTVYRLGFTTSDGVATSALTVFEDLDDDNNNAVLDRDLNQPPFRQNNVVADNDYAPFAIEYSGVGNPRFSLPSGTIDFFRVEKDGSWLQGNGWTPVAGDPLRKLLHLQGRGVTLEGNAITLSMGGTVNGQNVAYTAMLTVQRSNCLPHDPDGRRRIIAKPWLANRLRSTEHTDGTPVDVCTLALVVERPGVKVHYAPTQDAARLAIRQLRATVFAEIASQARAVGAAQGLSLVPRIGDSDQNVDIYLGEPVVPGRHPGIAINFALPPDDPATPAIEFDPRTTQSEMTIIIAEDASDDTAAHEMGHYLLPDAPLTRSLHWLNEGGANAVTWRTISTPHRDAVWGDVNSYFQKDIPLALSYYTTSPDAYATRYASWPIMTYLSEYEGEEQGYRKLWDALAFAQYEGQGVAGENARDLSWRSLGCGSSAQACQPLMPNESRAAASALLGNMFHYLSISAPERPLDYAIPQNRGLPNLPLKIVEVPGAGAAEELSATISSALLGLHTMSGRTPALPLRHATIFQTDPSGLSFDSQQVEFSGPKHVLGDEPGVVRAWLAEQMLQRVCGPNARLARIAFTLTSTNGVDGKALVTYLTPNGPTTIEVPASTSAAPVVVLGEPQICLEQGEDGAVFKIGDVTMQNTSTVNDVDGMLHWTITWN